MQIVSATFTDTVHDVALADDGTSLICPREGCGGEASSTCDFIPARADLCDRDGTEPYAYSGNTDKFLDDQVTMRTDTGLPVLVCRKCDQCFAHPDIRVIGNA